MDASYILAIDQGTSSTKTIIFDGQGNMLAKGVAPLNSYHFDGGFVEQDPEEIYRNVLESVGKCLDEFKAKDYNLAHIKTCGISNQRETFVVWDEQGKPLHNAVVWQCKRSIGICRRLTAEHLEATIRSKTGLIIDPYFSATKLMWLHENDELVKAAIDSGKAFFGTIDTWLLYRLTGGESYLTDYTNASRTLFFNLETLDWDTELQETFGLTGIKLPGVKPSSSFFGETNFDGLLDGPVSINAMIGDSHAAAFGESCFTPGTAKATLGTGCSVMMNIGSEPRTSANGMVTTICWSTEDRVDYAFEGVIVTCGATIEWLKTGLNLFAHSNETEAMATSVADNGGVYLVPAFSGLGAPHWDMSRKAAISGLTFDCNKNHIVRAALESIPYQIRDVIGAMEADAGISLHELMVDGGITGNRFVLQFLTDLLRKPVVNIGLPDVSALGAALLAGLKTGIFKDIAALETLQPDRHNYHPVVDPTQINNWYNGWKNAVQSK